MSEIQDPAYLAGGCITAQGDRQVLASLVCSEGVAFGANPLDPGGDLAVSQRGAGANMSVDVASGNAFVAGTTVGWQGMYHVSNDATKNLVIGAADPTNDRIDLIVARVKDSQYAGVVDDWSLAVVSGTAAPSPVAPTVPDNSLVLASILVQNGVTTIVNGDITDVRTPYVPCAGRPLPQELKAVSSGSFDPTLFPGYRYLEVEVQAGGGGGGGASVIDNTYGGGGGGGAYARQIIFANDITGTVTLTVGAGGNGGGGAANGAAGGTSSFGAIIVCTGGAGGIYEAGQGIAAGGAGGVCTAVGGGGFGTPGHDGGYGLGLVGPIMYPGAGGDSHLGQGGAARVIIANNTTLNGNPGGGYGAGGGGAATTDTVAGSGGDGADGLIIIRVYY